MSSRTGLAPTLIAVLTSCWATACTSQWKVDDVDGDGFTAAQGDCWDSGTDPGSGLSSADVHPGATDSWYDGIDQDCGGDSDFDQDGDGYDSAVEAAGPDCDDLDATISPDAQEICDEIDNDCDGLSDDEDDDTAKPTYYVDGDRDGYGDPDNSSTGDSCDPSPGFSLDGTDCQDTGEGADEVHPGADERCDGVDQDCDEEIDEDAVDAPAWCLDGDGDTFGDPDGTIASCESPGSSYVEEAACTDCDDDDAAIYPDEAVVEACDGLDNDCDGDTDEVDDDADGEVCYVDADEDAWGDLDETGAIRSCACPSGYASNTGDCDDSRDDINPDAAERCDEDLVDENCNGSINDSDSTLAASEKSTWYVDDDGDDYGGATTATSCEAPTGYTATDGDCDDADASRFPGASETCGDDIVNDCDGSAEDALLTCMGSGDPASTFEGSAASDALGSAVAAIGDVNGDGLPDAGVGATGKSSGKGTLYFLAGDEDLSGLSLSKIDDSTLVGAASADGFATSMSAIADTDGDGYAEFAVSSPYLNSGGNDKGAVYVVAGPLTAGSTVISATGAANATLRGATASDLLGFSVSAGDDWDDDGLADVAAGAPGYDPSSRAEAGAVYLFSADVTGTSAISSEAYATLTGSDAGEASGTSVAAIGDIKGDGYDDLLIGAPDNDDHHTGGGAAYLVEGPITSDGGLDSLATSAFYGADGDAAGQMVAKGGDLDGDGLPDLAIGAPENDDAGADAGAVYLVFDASTYGTVIDLSSVDVAITGAAAGDLAGTSIAAARDVDGDGNADLILGAPDGDDGGTDAGGAWLFFGPMSAGSLSLATDADLSWSGEAAGDHFGAAVAGVDDLDGDGFADLLVGAPDHANGTSTAAGASYLFLSGY